ncbi:FKBP-type peptidyl-prolyl cis-trans isomerase [Balneolales bacterium ANBcel1]|nr:FKBP-type peptidyl-prolyl cis-trans isomerase [Balneolales bacterium ANBcel1]
MKHLPLILLALALGLTSCLDNPSMDLDNEDDIAFLEENAQREGVTVTDSGLQYRVIEEGEGESPELGSEVRVHFIGTLIDGQVFDSTYEDDEPIQFFVRETIPGFAEGLTLMNEGAVYELVIPAELAYGNFQVGVIHPGATLIVELELLEIL